MDTVEEFISIIWHYTLLLRRVYNILYLYSGHQPKPVSELYVRYSFILFGLRRVFRTSQTNRIVGQWKDWLTIIERAVLRNYFRQTIVIILGRVPV